MPRAIIHNATTVTVEADYIASTGRVRNIIVDNHGTEPWRVRVTTTDGDVYENAAGFPVGVTTLPARGIITMQEDPEGGGASSQSGSCVSRRGDW